MIASGTCGLESSWGASTDWVRLATTYSAAESLLLVRVVVMVVVTWGYTRIEVMVSTPSVE